MLWAVVSSLWWVITVRYVFRVIIQLLRENSVGRVQSIWLSIKVQLSVFTHNRNEIKITAETPKNRMDKWASLSTLEASSCLVGHLITMRLFPADIVEPPWRDNPKCSLRSMCWLFIMTIFFLLAARAEQASSSFLRTRVLEIFFHRPKKTQRLLRTPPIIRRLSGHWKGKKQGIFSEGMSGSS